MAVLKGQYENKMWEIKNQQERQRNEGGNDITGEKQGWQFNVI